MVRNERTASGQFTEGNPGGPGRPRRATERTYLATLSDACPPGTWREIVERTVADAKDGDAKAREWLSRYLLGAPKSIAETLYSLAIDEEIGVDPVTDFVESRRAKAERKRATEERLRAQGLRPGSPEWMMAEIAEESAA